MLSLRAGTKTIYSACVYTRFMKPCAFLIFLQFAFSVLLAFVALESIVCNKHFF